MRRSGIHQHEAVPHQATRDLRHGNPKHEKKRFPALLNLPEKLVQFPEGDQGNNKYCKLQQ